MRKPKSKPKGGRSKFNWWRRFRTHKTLPAKAPLLDRIRNGDFEYSEMFKQAEWELDWMEEECNEFKKNYKGWEDPETDTRYMDIVKRYRKRYNKLYEDAMKQEEARLLILRDSLAKHYYTDVQVIAHIMETFDGGTEALFNFCRKNVAKVEKILYS